MACFSYVERREGRSVLPEAEVVKEDLDWYKFLGGIDGVDCGKLFPIKEIDVTIGNRFSLKASEGYLPH